MKISQLIDHTLLKSDATPDKIIQLCMEAKKYQFKSICIHPHYLPLINKELKGSKVLRCTVIGFPLGSNTTETKIFEIQNAFKIGVDEIDMVANLNAIKSKNWQFIQNEISLAQNECLKNKGILKVIIESSFLSTEEIIQISNICADLKVAFVKTSSGFNGSQASVTAVKLIKETVQDRCQIKASGGIRDLNSLQLMVKAGADRIGCSAGVKIVTDDSL